MKLWSDFHPYVLPDVTGCPIPLLDQTLCETARDFCTRTKAWIEYGEALEVDGTQIVFQFDTWTGTEMVSVVSASVDGDDYSVLDRKRLPASWVTGEQGDIKDKTIVLVSAQEYVVFPKPNAGQLIRIDLALRPALGASTVGDVVFDEHLESISAGTKAKLMAKPRKEWTDLQFAAFFGAQFEARIHAAANTDWRQSAEHRVSKAGL